MGRFAILLVLCTAAAGCGRSAADRATDGTGLDPRPLIAQVGTLDLHAATTSTAVLTATGIAAVQGYWEGALVPVDVGDPAVLAFAFRAVPPTGESRVSTPRSREVTVALALDEADLAGIREISVSGARNAVSVRR